MVIHKTIRKGGDGQEEVSLETSDNGVAIGHGYTDINGTIYLDWGEARELAETILMTAEAMFETKQGAPTDPAPHTAFAHLDATTVLSRGRHEDTP